VFYTKREIDSEEGVLLHSVKKVLITTLVLLLALFMIAHQIGALNYDIDDSLPNNDPYGGGLTPPSNENEVAAHKHEYSITIIAPTCDNGGYTLNECICGHNYKSDFLNALGHTYETTNVDATCVDRGYTIYTCYCGYSCEDDYVDALGHDYVTNVVLATCTESGYSENVCSLCGDRNTITVADPIGHDWSNWKVSKSPTTRDCGEEIRTCSYCFTQEKRTLDKLVGEVVDLKQGNRGIYDVLSYPSKSDFGEYYDQAVALYNIIATGDASGYDKWPSGIYGPDGYAHIFLPIDGFNDLTSEGQDEMAAQMAYLFSGMFNQKVLNGIIWLGFGMHDSVDGGVSIHFDTSAVHSRIWNQINDNSYDNALEEAGVYEGMTQIDAVVAINDWICNNVDYGKGLDALSVLNSGAAQCGGYASLFQQMCTRAGIQCQYIIGCVDDDPICATCHAWNRVKIDGQWYWIDVCWNDTGSNRNNYLLTTNLWGSNIHLTSLNIPQWWIDTLPRKQ
jgi:hypothetical protein